MKRKNLLYCFLTIMFLFSITSVMAQEDQIHNFGTFIKDSCIDIRRECSDCGYINLSIFLPNGSIIVQNEEMTNVGGGTWLYEYCNTSQHGRYEVLSSGDGVSIDPNFAHMFFDVNEFGINSTLFATYTIFYLGILFLSFLFVYKFATYNGGRVRDPNLFLWSAFVNLILFVIIEINGFGGSENLIVDIIKMVCFASGVYMLFIGIVNIVQFKKKKTNF